MGSRLYLFHRSLHKEINFSGRTIFLWPPFEVKAQYHKISGLGGAPPPPPPQGTPYNGLNGEAPPERGTFFRSQVFERGRISLVEVSERVGKFVIST